jgi:hypothetical protein
MTACNTVPAPEASTAICLRMRALYHHARELSLTTAAPLGTRRLGTRQGTDRTAAQASPSPSDAQREAATSARTHATSSVLPRLASSPSGRRLRIQRTCQLAEPPAGGRA